MGSRLYCMRWLVIQANLILMVSKYSNIQIFKYPNIQQTIKLSRCFRHRGHHYISASSHHSHPSHCTYQHQHPFNQPCSILILTIFFFREHHHIHRKCIFTSSTFCHLQVCGLVLLALGIWTMNDKSFLEELLRNRLYMDTTYIILISSTAMILLSCFGCFAAMKEIKCFLLT